AELSMNMTTGRLSTLLGLGLLFGLGTTVPAVAQVRTYFVTDALGSPILATDLNGNTAWSEDYLPYGERRINAAGSSGNTRWFTAAAQNPNTQLLYMGHRFMDPVQGRFVSMDPSGVSSTDGANFNRYWYANNNPYRYLDANGQEAATAEWLSRTDAMFKAWPKGTPTENKLE